MLSAFVIATAAAAAAVTAPALSTGRVVEFVQEFTPAAGEKVELWIPTPLEDAPYQKLLSRDFSGNASIVRVTTDDGQPAPYVYARWDGVATPTLRIVNVVEVFDRAGGAPDPSGGRAYLAPSAHVQTDGLVKETAATITAKAKDPDAKARAIFDWIVANTVRDPGIRGCGLGDVKSLLASGNLRGKCADLNSLFVGLARAAGVPAREVFGQRVAASALAPSLGKEGDNSKAQHCRAEYFSPKKGWVPVDPADVRKAILEEKLEANDPKLAKIRDALFGSWEGTWVAFNHARDFVLPGYDEKPINYFMYPLLASAKIRPDGVEAQETGYRFTTTVR